EIPANKSVYRETYTADGLVQAFDADGKLLADDKYTVRPTTEPRLRPDTRDLVVLSLPFRTREHIASGRSWDVDHGLPGWNDDDALALLAADIAESPREAFAIAKQRFFAKGDRRLGFFTLLLAASGARSASGEFFLGSEWLGLDPTKDHPDSPLAKYLAQHLQARDRRLWGSAQKLSGVTDNFIDRL